MTATANALSAAHFALAIVLLKIRPHNVTVEDFMLSLRQSLTNEIGCPSAVKPMLNAGRFWQSLYIREQQQNQQRESRILALQNQLHDISDLGHNQRQKRKREHDIGWSLSITNTQSKRRKLDVPSEIKVQADEIETEERNPDRTRLLQLILRLAQISHKDRASSIDDNEMVQLLRIACMEIVGSIRTADDKSTDTNASEATGLYLHEACHGARSIWLLMTQCIRGYQPAHDDAQLIKPLVSALASVVQFLLGRLHQYCLKQADDRSKLYLRKTKSRRSNTKATKQREAKSAQLFKHNCGTITSLIAHMLASTTSLHQAHPTVFEAVTCMFLDHLGSSMSLQLFGDAENKVEFGSLKPPRGPQDVAHTETNDAMLTTQLEAPYLIRVLCGLNPSLERVIRSEASNTSSGTLLAVANLGAVTRVRLQNTLLRGIFGDEDTAFANAFDRVEPEDIANPHGDTEIYELDENSRDWFLGQVWENLGWDVLFRQQRNNLE